MAKAEPDVGEHGEVGKQSVVLEHQADAAGLRRLISTAAGHAPVIDADLAGIGRVEPGDQAQQRALPAAGTAENGQDLARRQRE